MFIRFNFRFTSILKLLLALLVAITLVSSLAYADDDDGEPKFTDLSNIYDFKTLGGMDARLTPYGDNLMGDMIDKNTGGITFNHTDVSIPGNSGLEVALRRKKGQGSTLGTPFQHGFGDWLLDLPIAHVAYAPNPGHSGSPTDPQFDNGCLNTLGPMRRRVRAAGKVDLDYDKHVSGAVLYVPDQGLSGYPGDVKTPSDPKSDWTSGTRTTDFAGRCATVAVAPNGTKYKFGRHSFRQAKSMAVPYVEPFGCNGLHGCQYASEVAYIPRKYAVYLITEVEDVNGNWVRYDYTNNTRAELTRIYSNDGREINLHYNSYVPSITGRNSRLITQVTSNGRAWDYEYAGSTQSGLGYGFLKKATLPDGRYWRLGAANNGIRAIQYEPHVYYKCVPYDVSFEMKHPDGAIGTFRLRETRHVKGATTVGDPYSDDYITHYMTPLSIPHATDNSKCNGTSFPNSNQIKEFPWDRQVGWPIYQAMSVASKTISGSGIPTAKWDFEYRDYSGGSLQNNWTKITSPDGTQRTYTHRAVGNDHGLLKSVDVNPISGAGETITYEHNQMGGGAPGGIYGVCHADPQFENVTPGLCNSFLKRPITKKVHQRDGDTYTSEYDYDFGTSLQNYASGPVMVKTYTNVSTSPRITNTEYEHNSSKWILSLTNKVTRNGRELATVEYDNLGQVERVFRYGQEAAEYSYNTDGTLDWTEDALNRRTKVIGWKRGRPLKVYRAYGTPDQISMSQTVDYNGWVKSQTDALARVTSYDHDNMGRLKLIDPPASWDNTIIGYSFPSSGAIQTITKGNSKTTIEYDAMYRPVLERSQAIDTSWNSYTRSEYDSLGRLTFKSQPSDLSTESAGLNYTYDGLGRLKTQSENVGPSATTIYEYLNQHRRRVTDPSGAYTDYYSYGYGGPSDDESRYVKKYSNMGQRLQWTTTYRDIHGQLKYAQQWGDPGGYGTRKTHNYYYDSQQRLCRDYSAEGVATRYQYDVAGQVTAYAKGASNSGCGPIGWNPAKVSQLFDKLGRLETVNYQDAQTPDIHRTYDAVGNLRTINRGAGSTTVAWSYDYNELNLLEYEQLDIDGRNFDIAYDYNNSGHLTQKILPSQKVINYTRDGLGRSIAIDYEAQSMVSGVSYHSSGAVKDMSYGNGHDFTQSLNERLLPKQLLALKNDQTAIDLNYLYDPRGKVTSMIDFAVAGNNRSFDYDGMGRLKSASGPWGQGSYNYDGLNNLTSKTLGDRVVSLTYDTKNKLYRSTDNGKNGTRRYRYDARGNVTSTSKANDACIITKELDFIGQSGTGTVWNHVVRFNTCTQKIVSIVTTSAKDNLAPVEDTYSFSTISKGASQSPLKAVYVPSSGEPGEVEVKATYGYNNILTLQHRVKWESHNNWTPFVSHGSIDANSFSPNCSVSQYHNFGGGGGTSWTHQVNFDRCTGEVASINTYSTNNNLSPKYDWYGFGSISKGGSATRFSTAYIPGNGLTVDIRVQATYATNNVLSFKHSVKIPGETSWRGWVEHGGINGPAQITIPSTNNSEYQSFRYDYSDQPVQISGKANGNYRYDGNMKRVRASVDGKVIYNVYDLSGNLVYIFNASKNKKTDYLNGPMGPFARITNNEVTYLHPDLLGSSQTGTNSDGDVLWRESYSPFGEALINSPANDNQAGFTGHIKDSATGLNYMQARYYDPTIGRFLSIDPVDFMQTGDPRFFNRYAYTFNDPVNLTDPDGRNPAIDRRADAGAQAMRDCGAPCGAVVEAGAGFTPLGPYMDFTNAHANGNGVLKSIGIAAAGALNPFKKAEKIGDAADAIKLNKKLASEQQMSQLKAGNGKVMAGGDSGTEFRDAAKKADAYGGDAGDYVKVKSDADVTPDGMSLSTHGVQNQKTGELFEPKSIIDERAN